MINFSPEAAKILQDKQGSAERDDLLLRIEIVGRTQDDFQYRLIFLPKAMKAGDDFEIESAGLQLLVDPFSAAYLEGAQVEFVEQDGGGGFKIENPNPLWHEPLGATVQTLIDGQINPSIATHGGFVQLRDVKDNVAYISMGGGCQGCGMANVTLKHGVEKMIKDTVPSIKAVVDTTEHALGENPYFQPEQAGDSPLS
jgi:Fe/S biogenesis protein NfuA